MRAAFPPFRTLITIGAMDLLMVSLYVRLFVQTAVESELREKHDQLVGQGCTAFEFRSNLPCYFRPLLADSGLSPGSVYGACCFDCKCRFCQTL